jgi:phosphonoacetaldehyde hydrolase
MAKIAGVICDWAGTTVDFGCLSPVAAFAKAFNDFGHPVSFEEIRTFMGILKFDHVKALLELTKERFIERFGRESNQTDAADIYSNFETALFESLSKYAKPINGAVEFGAFLQKKSIPLGSTTGYTAKMMDIVASEAAKYGFAAQCIVTPKDDLPGRPHPFLIYQNAIKLGCYPLWNIVKIGDTVSDMKEGRNAGCWCVGVSVSGNEMGLSEAEISTLDADTFESKKTKAKETLENAGAHLVIDGIWDGEKAFETIQSWIDKGYTPKEILCS